MRDPLSDASQRNEHTDWQFFPRYSGEKAAHSIVFELRLNDNVPRLLPSESAVLSLPLHTSIFRITPASLSSRSIMHSRIKPNHVPSGTLRDLPEADPP